jgi:hypothetical protein
MGDMCLPAADKGGDLVHPFEPNICPTQLRAVSPIVLRLIAAHEYDALLHPEFLALVRANAVRRYRGTGKQAGPERQAQTQTEDGVTRPKCQSHTGQRTRFGNKPLAAL